MFLQKVNKNNYIKSRKKSSCLKRLIVLFLLIFTYIFPLSYANAEILDKNKEYNFSVNEVYANALYLAGRKEKLKHFLDLSILKEDKLSYLNKYITMAKNYNLPKVVNRAYRQILVFFPDDLEAFKNIGENAFYAQNISTAEYYIKRYNEKTGGDYLTNYIYGEVLFYYGQYFASKTYFKKAIEELDNKEANKITVQDCIIKANLLYRLEKPHEAADLYKKTVEANPDDLFLKLDYIDFLLTLNHTYTAAKLIKDFEKKQKSNKRIMAFVKSNYTKDEKKRLKQSEQLLKTRLYQREGRLNEAFNTLDKLKEENPNINTPRYHLALADTLALQNDKMGESYSLNDIAELQPENEVILKRKKQREKENGSFFQVDGGFLMGKDRDGTMSYQYLTTETLNLRINKYWSIGAIYQQDLITSDKIQQLGGKEGPYTGLRQRNEFYTTFDIPGNKYLNTSVLKLSYYIGNDYNFAKNSGLGFDYDYLDKWGYTNIVFDWRKPYWELPSAVVQGANKSRVGIGRELKVIPNLYLYGYAGYNSYGVQDEASVGESWQFEVNAQYKLPVIKLQEQIFGSNSRFAINYSMDAEFYNNVKEKTRVDGTSYKVLQLDSRQVNSFYLSFFKEITENCNYYVYGGYAVDTIGEMYHGAVFGAKFYYKILDCLEIEAVADHNIGIIVSSYVGIGLKWNFAHCYREHNRSWF